MVDHRDRTLAGRYRLLERIGSGGMGTVWRGHDEVLRRDVAVKEVRLPYDLGEDLRATLEERAMREARAAARLDHPNIIEVYDVVLDDGRPWIVMRLVAGRSLDRLVRDEGPLPPRRVAEIGLALLDALDAAHARQVLHRDLKPANVLVGADGRVVLTDFGIASMADAPQLTRTGVLIGSPGYMAPERLGGVRAGPPSDLWSLGATLYYAVEGEPAYTAEETPALIGAVLTREPPRPRRAGPLAPVILGLLAKDPARRLDAGRARARLRGVLTGTAREKARSDDPSADRADGTGSTGGTGSAGSSRTRPMDGAGPTGGPTRGGGHADQQDRPPKKKSSAGTFVFAAIVLAVLNAMRVQAVTRDGRFPVQPACATIVAGELTRLLPRAVSTSSCAWSSPGTGAGPWTLTVVSARYTRRVTFFTGKSGDHFAHLAMARQRDVVSGPVQDRYSIGAEAFKVTTGTTRFAQTTLYFRVSNLIVVLRYTRAGQSLDPDATGYALEDSATRMAARLA